MTANDPPPAPPGVQPPSAPSPVAAAIPSVASQRWRNNRPLANALTVLLVINGIAAAVAIVLLARRLSIFSDIENRRSGFGALYARDADAANSVQSIAITMVVLLLVTTVVFIVWMWRSAKNNDALGRQQPRFRSGWAIGAWFIPFANLVIPVLIMQDLWRGSDTSFPRGDARWKIADRSALVGWWWGLLLASRISSSVFSGNRDDTQYTIAELRTNVNLAIVSCLLSIAAAVLGVLVVRQLTERQEECLRVQREQWGQASAAPAPPS